MSFWIVLIYLFTCIITDSDCFADPCSPLNHAKFPSIRMGSRNRHCNRMPSNMSLCDYYLIETWYVTDDAVLLNTCPNDSGTCGVAYPAFLDGDFPEVADGIVNRTACIKHGSQCCKEAIPMQLKNCSGFYAYNMKPLKECSSAYCFESSLPCIETTTAGPTSTSTTTASKGKEEGGGVNSKTVLIGTTVGVGVVLCLTTIVVAIVVIKTGWMKTQKQVSASKVAQPHIDNLDSYHNPPVCRQMHGKN